MTRSAPMGVAVFAGQIESPCALVEVSTLERNLSHVAHLAADRNVAIRPHVKTHKCASIAKRQLELGAMGVTVATLAEAAGMIDAGIEDILVYYPIVGEPATAGFLELAGRGNVNVSTTVEDFDGVDYLDSAARRAGTKVDVLIDVDTGLGRTGITIGRLKDLARHVERADHLSLTGIGTHEGFAYSLRDPNERSERVSARLAEFVAAGQELGVGTISCGATPSLPDALSVEGITEIRPGNYALLDRIQIDLGVADPDDCAFTVLSTVISVRDGNRATVDAGSKALSSDRGAHGGAHLPGYGLVRDHPGISIPALSEEHGFLEIEGASTVKVGERLRIVPNHSCSTVANFGSLTFVDGEDIVTVESLVGRRGGGEVAL